MQGPKEAPLLEVFAYSFWLEVGVYKTEAGDKMRPL